MRKLPILGAINAAAPPQVLDFGINIITISRAPYTLTSYSNIEIETRTKVENRHLNCHPLKNLQRNYLNSRPRKRPDLTASSKNESIVLWY